MLKAAKQRLNFGKYERPFKPMPRLDAIEKHYFCSRNPVGRRFKIPILR